VESYNLYNVSIEREAVFSDLWASLRHEFTLILSIDTMRTRRTPCVRTELSYKARLGVVSRIIRDSKKYWIEPKKSQKAYSIFLSVFL